MPLEFDNTWLYDGLADIYSDFLDDDAEDMFRWALFNFNVANDIYAYFHREGGYYTTEISPGFRFVAINSLFGYTLNL